MGFNSGFKWLKGIKENYGGLYEDIFSGCGY